MRIHGEESVTRVARELKVIETALLDAMAQTQRGQGIRDGGRTVILWIEGGRAIFVKYSPMTEDWKAGESLDS